MAMCNSTPESRSSQNNSLFVLSHPVRRRGEFYSLNDLHEASGGDPGCHPERFLASPVAEAWVAELGDGVNGEGRARSALIQGESTGRARGSVSVFGRRELVLAYALWVGDGFALAVLRALGAPERPAALDSAPHTRYELGYVRDLRWDEDRPGDIAWWEFDGQDELTAEEAAGRGRDFFEQTRRLARVNPGDAEMALKYSLLRLMDGSFPGRGFRYCEMVFCEWLSRAAVVGMVSGGGEEPSLE